MSTAKKKEEEEVVHLPPIKGERFGLMAHKAQQFNAFVPADITREQLTDRRLWAHVATQISPYAEIRAIHEEGAYMARLLVTHKNGADLRLFELEFRELDKIEDIEAHPDFEIKSRGAVLKWCIIRRSDGVIVKEKIPDQAQALRDLGDHLRALGDA